MQHCSVSLLIKQGFPFSSLDLEIHIKVMWLFLPCSFLGLRLGSCAGATTSWVALVSDFEQAGIFLQFQCTSCQVRGRNCHPFLSGHTARTGEKATAVQKKGTSRKKVDFCQDTSASL
ncbi:Hypothetical predicted protein [Podarcis lilfordi]|uniref:Uncharacterized protein n=1 Tax=Podarcis lilfordi TaxID=74358 RepID=A0AA35KUH2_9SAUR|nr:Hypothetical predicted protein [Podarcis lilfordi]